MIQASSDPASTSGTALDPDMMPALRELMRSAVRSGAAHAASLSGPQVYGQVGMVHTGSGCLLQQVQLFEQLGGRSVETGQRHVAYVGQVLTANRS